MLIVQALLAVESGFRVISEVDMKDRALQTGRTRKIGPTRRAVVAFTTTSAILVASAAPAGASANYASSGTFWSFNGQCPNWGHSWTSWTQVTTGQVPRTMVNLSGYAAAMQNSCWSALDLPQGWIFATGDLYWWRNNRWEVWMHKSVTNVGGGHVASFSQDAGVRTGFYYTRGRWQALRGGALHTKETGSEYPVQFIQP